MLESITFGIIGGRGITTVRYRKRGGEWILDSATRRGKTIPWHHSPGWVLERCMDVDLVFFHSEGTIVEYIVRDGVLVGGTVADRWQSGMHLPAPEELLVTA